MDGEEARIVIKSTQPWNSGHISQKKKKQVNSHCYGVKTSEVNFLNLT